MIVDETAIHQITVEFKLIQVLLQPSIMNYRFHSITDAVKGPQNTKCETIHET